MKYKGWLMTAIVAFVSGGFGAFVVLSLGGSFRPSPDAVASAPAISEWVEGFQSKVSIGVNGVKPTPTTMVPVMRTQQQFTYPETQRSAPTFDYSQYLKEQELQDLKNRVEQMERKEFFKSVWGPSYDSTRY